jgi:hypothetical protein
VLGCCIIGGATDCGAIGWGGAGAADPAAPAGPPAENPPAAGTPAAPGVPGRGTMPAGNAPSNCVRSCRFDGRGTEPPALPAADEAPPLGPLPEAAPGLAMLGMISVPGIRFPPPAVGSELGAGATDCDAAEATPIPPADGRFEAGWLLSIASTDALRRESMLLTARGDTCGAPLGSPTPGVVLASSGENETGGGP